MRANPVPLATAEMGCVDEPTPKTDLSKVDWTKFNKRTRKELAVKAAARRALLAAFAFVALLTVGFVVALIAVSVRGSDAKLRLFDGMSWCTTDPLDARLYVYVTIQNDGSDDGSINLRPWRRYSDGSSNASVVDEFKMTVPAHDSAKVYNRYDYNAEKHELIECGVYLGDVSSPTEIAVR
jgi:hypothetical protein